MNREKMFRHLARSVPRVYRIPRDTWLTDDQEDAAHVRRSAQMLGRLGSVTISRGDLLETNEDLFRLSVSPARRRV